MFDSHLDLLMLHACGLCGTPRVIVVAGGYRPHVTRVREPRVVDSPSIKKKKKRKNMMKKIPRM
jgi:hypothetical protein